MASPVKPRMTTADPSVFSFFPEIFLFGVFAKKKDRKKAIDLGPVESFRAECAHLGLQQAG